MDIRWQRRQAGFSLLEVLVAAAVLGVGLAGLAALLLKSIAGTASSLSRSSAALHVESMTELIRINPLGVPVLESAPPVNAPVCDASSACNPEDFARHSLWHWQQGVAGDLPGGSTEICMADAADESLNCSVPVAIVRWTAYLHSGDLIEPSQVVLRLPL
jgi:type IV pilus assembly protein PilV